MASLPETSPRRPGALGSLVPQVGLPPATRRAVVVAAPVLFAVWALGGFYASLGPSLIDRLAGSNSVALTGAGLGILALVAAVVTYVLRATGPRRVMMVGTATLIPGVAATLLAVEAGSAPAFLAATALAGVGFGAGFQGGIRLVAPLASPGERAGVLSVLYIVSYLGLGVPAVLAGLAVVHGVGLLDTTYWYGLAVILLAILATANLIRTPAQASRKSNCGDRAPAIDAERPGAASEIAGRVPSAPTALTSTWSNPMPSATSTTGEPRLSARDRLLAAADALFYAEGVQSVGIDRVIERAGVAKASLYHSFSSKEELVAAYLKGRQERIIERLNAAIAEVDNPRDKVVIAVFNSQAQQLSRHDFRGCAFAAASTEAPSGGLVQEVTEGYRRWLRDLLTDLVRQAGAADPSRLGRQLQMVYDGAALAGRMDHWDTDIATSAREAAEALLDASVPRRSRRSR